jgi:hypothetical protein
VHRGAVREEGATHAPDAVAILKSDWERRVAFSDFPNQLRLGNERLRQSIHRLEPLLNRVRPAAPKVYQLLGCFRQKEIGVASVGYDRLGRFCLRDEGKAAERR